MLKTTKLHKLWAVVLFCAFSLFSFAQTPPADLNGEALKQWLKTNYYTGKHSQLGYSTARQKMYNYIDNKNNTITGVYSGYEKAWTAGGTGTNPAPINCEHTVPQSFFGESEPMKSDIHHLFPTYDRWNSERSNHPFDDITDANTDKWMYETSSQTSTPTSNIDLYSESDGSKFEPREDHKGNCARAIFYFYTMYPTAAGDISRVADVNTLYQWHLSDPVDAAEINRNDGVETYQGNRNPYIDHPELVQRAWLNNTVGLFAPTVSIQTNETTITVSWTNVADETGYKVYRSTDNTNFSEVHSVSADVLEYEDATVVENTNYYYYVIAFNDEGSSATSNVVSGALIADGGGTSNDLFFSEYIEGSSYDKVLEIANFTGDVVDLSNYSIFKQSNGSGQWGSELALSGSLANGDVYVICHYQANSTIKASADMIEPSDSWTLSFNGNDPLGLFKNGTYIDAIGTFNSSSKFGENTTLIRKSTISGPTTIFNLNDWDEKAQGYITNLGLHTMTATGIDNGLLKDLYDVKIGPNPANDKVFVHLTNLDGIRSIEAELYDVAGKKVYGRNEGVDGNAIQTEVNVSMLNGGVYFLILKVGDNVLNSKLVVK